MKRIVALLALAALLPGCAGEDGRPDAAEVGGVLDDWHEAAAQADEERYFGHFAPDGVFLGTDDGERWTVEEFRAYAHPHFVAGRGWTYRPSERHVAFSADGRIAWADEKLDNDKYGRLRGTGVLRRSGGGWKLVHYSMSFTIPNERTVEAVAVIRGEAGSD